MRWALVSFSLLLCSCDRLERVLGHESPPRDVVYGSLPTTPQIEPQEPYATFAGTHGWPDGSYSRLFLVHWQGNSLNMVSMLEEDLDVLGIPKFIY